MPEPFQAAEDTPDQLKEGVPAGLSDSKVSRPAIIHLMMNIFRQGCRNHILSGIHIFCINLFCVVCMSNVILSLVMSCLMNCLRQVVLSVLSALPSSSVFSILSASSVLPALCVYLVSLLHKTCLIKIRKGLR